MDIRKYIEDNAGKDIRFKNWIDSFLIHLDRRSVILDLGSGLGYNADYMESKGYLHVIRADVAQEFIDFQKKKVYQFDIFCPKKDRYDTIFMCQFVSMFSPRQLMIIFNNLRNILKPCGVVAFNVPVEWEIRDIYSLCKTLIFTRIDVSKDATWWFVNVIV